MEHIDSDDRANWRALLETIRNLPDKDSNWCFIPKDDPAHLPYSKERYYAQIRQQKLGRPGAKGVPEHVDLNNKMLFNTARSNYVIYERLVSLVYNGFAIWGDPTLEQYASVRLVAKTISNFIKARRTLQVKLQRDGYTWRPWDDAYGAAQLVASVVETFWRENASSCSFLYWSDGTWHGIQVSEGQLDPAKDPATGKLEDQWEEPADYAEYVKYPVYLVDIFTRLYTGQYGSAEELDADMRQCFRNAIIYYADEKVPGEGQPEYHEATRLLHAWENIWRLKQPAIQQAQAGWIARQAAMSAGLPAGSSAGSSSSSSLTMGYGMGSFGVGAMLAPIHVPVVPAAPNPDFSKVFSVLQGKGPSPSVASGSGGSTAAKGKAKASGKARAPVATSYSTMSESVPPPAAALPPPSTGAPIKLKLKMGGNAKAAVPTPDAPANLAAGVSGDVGNSQVPLPPSVPAQGAPSVAEPTISASGSHGNTAAHIDGQAAVLQDSAGMQQSDADAAEAAVATQQAATSTHASADAALVPAPAVHTEDTPPLLAAQAAAPTEEQQAQHEATAAQKDVVPAVVVPGEQPVPPASSASATLVDGEEGADDVPMGGEEGELHQPDRPVHSAEMATNPFGADVPTDSLVPEETRDAFALDVVEASEPPHSTASQQHVQADEEMKLEDLTGLTQPPVPAVEAAIGYDGHSRSSHAGQSGEQPALSSSGAATSTPAPSWMSMEPAFKRSMMERVVLAVQKYKPVSPFIKGPYLLYTVLKSDPSHIVGARPDGTQVKYTDVIAKPMCMDMVEGKLSRGEYIRQPGGMPDPLAMKEDLLLIGTNCLTFNKGDPVYEWVGQQWVAGVNKSWANIFEGGVGTKKQGRPPAAKQEGQTAAKRPRGEPDATEMTEAQQTPLNSQSALRPAMVEGSAAPSAASAPHNAPQATAAELPKPKLKFKMPMPSALPGATASDAAAAQQQQPAMHSQASAVLETAVQPPAATQKPAAVPPRTAVPPKVLPYTPPVQPAAATVVRKEPPSRKAVQEALMRLGLVTLAASSTNMAQELPALVSSKASGSSVAQQQDGAGTGASAEVTAVVPSTSLPVAGLLSVAAEKPFTLAGLEVMTAVVQDQGVEWAEQDLAGAKLATDTRHVCLTTPTLAEYGLIRSSPSTTVHYMFLYLAAEQLAVALKRWSAHPWAREAAGLHWEQYVLDPHGSGREGQRYVPVVQKNTMPAPVSSWLSGEVVVKRLDEVQAGMKATAERLTSLYKAAGAIESIASECERTAKAREFERTCILPPYRTLGAVVQDVKQSLNLTLALHDKDVWVAAHRTGEDEQAPADGTAASVSASVQLQSWPSEVSGLYHRALHMQQYLQHLIAECCGNYALDQCQQRGAQRLQFNRLALQQPLTLSTTEVLVHLLDRLRGIKPSALHPGGNITVLKNRSRHFSVPFQDSEYYTRQGGLSELLEAWFGYLSKQGWGKGVDLGTIARKLQASMDVLQAQRASGVKYPSLGTTAPHADSGDSEDIISAAAMQASVRRSAMHTNVNAPYSTVADVQADIMRCFDMYYSFHSERAKARGEPIGPSVLAALNEKKVGKPGKISKFGLNDGVVASCARSMASDFWPLWAEACLELWEVTHGERTLRAQVALQDKATAERQSVARAALEAEARAAGNAEHIASSSVWIRAAVSAIADGQLNQLPEQLCEAEVGVAEDGDAAMGMEVDGLGGAGVGLLRASILQSIASKMGLASGRSMSAASASPVSALMPAESLRSSLSDNGEVQRAAQATAPIPAPPTGTVPQDIRKLLAQMWRTDRSQAAPVVHSLAPSVHIVAGGSTRAALSAYYPGMRSAQAVREWQEAEARDMDQDETMTAPP